MTNEAARVRFGAEVRRRREFIGMTLEVLAARAGLTPNYVGGVEIGKRDPSLSTVLGLAKGLGISPGELFSSRYGISPAAEEAARYFDKLEPGLQEAVMMLLRSDAERPKPSGPSGPSGARKLRGPRKGRRPQKS